MYGQMPPVAKMDASLDTLLACERLSLSTNSLGKIDIGLSLPNLRILSLGRNNLKKIEKLDGLPLLEELWVSYNQISSLDGLAGCANLTRLYIGNNQIKSFEELQKLQNNANFNDLLLFGNPCHTGSGLDRNGYRVEVVRNVPAIGKVDGDLIKPSERAEAEEPVE